MKHKIYIENTPLHEAIEKWTNKLTISSVNKPLQGEPVKVIDSLGRVTAEPVFAKISSPSYHASAMDGYAVKFTDTFGASEVVPKHLKIPEQAIYVATGDPMPDGFNSVIMVEDINIIKGQGTRDEGQENPLLEYIEIIKPATPWQHVRTVGEDIVTTELILPENTKIRPVDVGAMLAGGLTEIKTRRKPRIVIIPTGNELVEPGTKLKKGNIIEFNSSILSGLVTEWGGEPIRLPVVPDNIDELKKTILEATETGDLVVINAGVSAGAKDFTFSAIKDLGDIILHGLNIKPGKPVILGWINNKPVLGIPGYPVSAYITFELFSKALIYAWQGLAPERTETIIAKLTRQVASTMGKEEFLRVKVGVVGGKVIASPLGRGAGMLMSLVRADGFVRIPAMSEGLSAGKDVEVNLIQNKNKISNTLVCIGSHDNILDVLASFLKKKYPTFSLSSTHVGSMGGLVAIKRREAHIAGTHLLDEETGEYNVPFIKRLLSDNKIILINLVHRQQGLLVLKGNPKNIKGFEDLLRDDITFINRQSGSGTRLLLDKYLKDLKIDPKKIRGYGQEEYTHMTVASGVLNGIADTGLGIYAASKSLGLDFIPIAKERYDLAVPEEFYKLDITQKLLEIIRNDMEFRETVKKLGGYDTADMGKIIYGG